MTAPTTPATPDEVERLLSGRTRDIRLGPELMGAFRDRSFKQSSKIIRAWMIWVILLDILSVVSSLLLLPHSAALAMLGPALLLPPAAAMVFAVWSRRHPDSILDTALVAGMSAILLAVALMGYAAGGEFLERYLSIMLFVAVTAVIIFNVPQWVTHAIAGIGLLIYLVFQLAHPQIGTASAISAFLFFASGVTSTVVARRTMSILAHRTFLLELRDARRVSELASTNAKLEHLSRTDPLTGLSNRRHTGVVLADLFGPARNRRPPLALLMCDIDCFKPLNDRLGHLEGDRALIQVAEIIAASVHPDRDHVSRFGGEEFLIVLTAVNADEALAIAERIRRKVMNARIANPDSSAAKVVTVSIGIATEAEHPGSSATELQQLADAALYAAKSHGRNRVEIATSAGKHLSAAR